MCKEAFILIRACIVTFQIHVLNLKNQFNITVLWIIRRHKRWFQINWTGHLTCVTCLVLSVLSMCLRVVLNPLI